MAWLPFGARVPPHAPEAAQEPALEEVHVKDVEPPAAIVISAALNDTVGKGAGWVVPPPHADSQSAEPSISSQA